MYPDMKLRIILIVLSLMAFLSALTGGYLYYSSIKNAALEEANRQAVFHTETIKSHLSYFLHENLNSVRALAGLKELPQALSKRDEDALAGTNFILDHFKNTYQADVCYLIDRDGNTIASSNRNSSDSFVGQNYAFRPYFQHAIRGDPTIYLGYMALGVTSGRRGIYYSHSVYEDGQDTPAGVAVIKAPIDPIEREFVKDYEGIVMLTDPHGIVFISNRTEWILDTLSKLSPAEITQMKGFRQFGEGPRDWTGLTMIDETHAIDSLGNKYLFHKLALDSYPGWDLIFLSDIKSIINRVSKPLIKISGYLILTLCVFIGLAVFILHNKANREIDQRRKAEDALRKAHDDLEKRVDERTSDLINDLIQEVVSLINTEAMIRNVSIETTLDGSLAPVLGDRIHLQQVMINFILNASEAMTDIADAPRRILISTSKADQKMVKVGIRDFGSGIIEGHLNQIMEPFYTTKPDGMGMGLSINRSIIDAHAGRFWAENNPDRGGGFFSKAL
jgi:C4-dicarboxylate-specific signal transduction histidine kinase